MSIKELVDQILEDGVLTEEEHERFIEMVYADGEVDQDESEQISRIFALIREGKITVVNESRDSAYNKDGEG